MPKWCCLISDEDEDIVEEEDDNNENIEEVSSSSSSSHSSKPRRRGISDLGMDNINIKYWMWPIPSSKICKFFISFLTPLTAPWKQNLDKLNCPSNWYITSDILKPLLNTSFTPVFFVGPQKLCHLNLFRPQKPSYFFIWPLVMWRLSSFLSQNLG